MNGKTYKCKQEKCREIANSSGFCAKHYHLAVRNNKLESKDKCSEPGCDDNRYAKGLCYTHYLRMQRGSVNITNYYTEAEEEIITKNYNTMSMTELLKLLPGRTKTTIKVKARKLGLFKYSKKTTLADNFAGRIMRYIPEVLEDINLKANGKATMEELFDDDNGYGNAISADLLMICYTVLKPVDFDIVFESLNEGKTFEEAGKPYGKSASVAQSVVKRSAKKLVPYAKKVLEGLGYDAVQEAKADMIKKNTKGLCKIQGCRNKAYNQKMCVQHYCKENSIVIPFSDGDAEGAMSLNKMAELIGVPSKKLRGQLDNVPHYKLNSRIVFLDRDRTEIEVRVN